MELRNLRCETEDGIALITLDRPKALNALDTDTLRELDGLLDELAVDDAVRVLILTGAGEKAFVAGADIKELAELSPLRAREHAAFGQGVFSKLESLGKPSIAAINGFALGGGLELAMACTLRLASEKAKLGLPEITLGLIPGFGGTQRLSRLVGQGHARFMVLTGGMIDAERAGRIGLVNDVVAPDALMDRARGRGGRLQRGHAAPGRTDGAAGGGDGLRRRPGLRGRPVRRGRLDRRREGGHGRLRREAQARVPGPLIRPAERPETRSDRA